MTIGGEASVHRRIDRSDISLQEVVGQQQRSKVFRSRIFFKCVDELPPGTFKKERVTCRRKGIMRCDWFNKIMDKSPMLIFMVFNYTQPLDPNEKWQDRLSLTLRKINKVYDIIRSSRNEQVNLRIIIIISKQAVMQSQVQGSVLQRIINFLKNYEKELNIYQQDLLTKEVGKNKGYWFNMLEKSYQKKIRKIMKRREERDIQGRLGCIVKIAILTEILSKKDSSQKYDQAYRSIHFRFIQITKSRLQFINLDLIRQLRTIADIVLLRKLVVKMSLSNNFQTVPDTISNHLKYFVGGSGGSGDHQFFSFQTLIWRENFLQNLLQVLYKSDVDVVPKSYFSQLVNNTISLAYNLSKAQKQRQQLQTSNQLQSPRGRIIPIDKQVYIGSHNYTMGVQITDLDILFTQISQLVERKKDFITRGLQTIGRYNDQSQIKKHQANFFNIYQLRFYLLDEKLNQIKNKFNEIIKMKIQEYDFYSLNYLIEELEKETDKEKIKSQKIVVHGLAVLIADYFKNKQELEKYGKLLIDILSSQNSIKPIKSSQIDLLSDISQTSTVTNPQTQIPTQSSLQPLILPLPTQSLIFTLEAIFPNKLHMIENKLQFLIIPKFNNKFLVSSGKKAILRLFFNKPEIQISKQINFEDYIIDNGEGIKIQIDPLLYFSKDQTLQLTSSTLILETLPTVHLLLQNITFPKYRQVTLLTKLKVPEISIKLPYQIYYLNQISKFIIKVDAADKETKIDVSFTVIEEPKTESLEVFADLGQRLNIVNSGVFVGLVVGGPLGNIMYMKCSKVSTKVLKFVFNITITQIISNKQLKDFHVVTKQIGFKTNTLFKTIKILKESYSGQQIKPNQVPVNKNIILNYNIRACESVLIEELGQHTNPKGNIRTLKGIKGVKDYQIKRDEKINSVYLFVVEPTNEKDKEKKEIFLSSFYIKWSRTDMDQKLGLTMGPENSNMLSLDQPHSHTNNSQSGRLVNIYTQDQLKISIIASKIEIQYCQGKTLRKRQKQSLQISFRNLTSDRVHIYSIMDNSEQILRIGSRSSEVWLDPHETRSLSFQVLPVKSGYFKFPVVRNFFDGVLVKEKGCDGTICVV